MVADRVHLVRHGEVANPDRVLYARLPGFDLSPTGVATAGLAAERLASLGRPVTRLVTSPLERARQSAAPIARRFGVEPEIDESVIEASSRLEGGAYRMDLSILARPRAWRYLVNPFRPSWGEPFTKVAARMLESIERVAASAEDGDAVIVSHQLPIWMVHRAVSRRPLFHDPRARRCALSSITTIERGPSGWHETEYWRPPIDLGDAVDVGAV